MRVCHQTPDGYLTCKLPPMSYRLTIGRPEKSRVDQVIGAVKLNSDNTMVIYASPQSVYDDVIRS